MVPTYMNVVELCLYQYHYYLCNGVRWLTVKILFNEPGVYMYNQQKWYKNRALKYWNVLDIDNDMNKVELSRTFRRLQLYVGSNYREVQSIGSTVLTIT